MLKSVPDGYVYLLLVFLIWFQCFPSFIPTGLLLRNPLGVQYCRSYGLELPASSVTTGMRGAKAGVRRGKSPVVMGIVYFFSVFRSMAIQLFHSVFIIYRFHCGSTAMGARGALNSVLMYYSIFVLVSFVCSDFSFLFVCFRFLAFVSVWFALFRSFSWISIVSLPGFVSIPWQMFCLASHSFVLSI